MAAKLTTTIILHCIIPPIKTNAADMGPVTLVASVGTTYWVPYHYSKATATHF